MNIQLENGIIRETGEKHIIYELRGKLPSNRSELSAHRWKGERAKLQYLHECVVSLFISTVITSVSSSKQAIAPNDYVAWKRFQLKLQTMCCGREQERKSKSTVILLQCWLTSWFISHFVCLYAFSSAFFKIIYCLLCMYVCMYVCTNQTSS